MPGKRKTRSAKTKEPTTSKQTKKKVVEESEEEESPVEEKVEKLGKRVTRGSTKKSTEPAKKKKKKEPIEEDEQEEEEEIEAKPASKKTTSKKKQSKAEKPVEEKEETKPTKQATRGKTTKEKTKQPIQKDEADIKSKSTSYETKNLPVSDSRAQARIKKAQTPSAPGEPALTVDLISTLFKAVREQLPSKMQDQMEDPNANPNSMTFYKQGFEDCLKLVKNKLPADFAVDVGSAIVPTTPKNEVPAAEVLVAPARVIPFEIPIPNFKGRIFSRGDPKYEENRYQYAFSSVEKKNPGQIAPKHILYPKDDEDVLLAIKYAKENQIRIAIRTGGHQYSGASSTNGDNILLDMSETYLDFTEENGLIKTGISHTLREFNHRLSDQGRFVPHGQCSHVHLGGHVQTGGYGQLGRSFGLFADHVQKIRIITAAEQIKEIERNTSDGDEKELFWAVLGGSPGNLGVLTHLWLKTYKNEDHPNSRGLKAVYFYSKDRLKRLLDLIVDMEVDDNFPRNYDLCVTVLSSSQLILPHLWPNADEKMKEFHPEIYGRNDLPFWGPMIVVYAQWADLGNLDPNQKPCDLGWFKKIKAAGGIPVLPNDVNYKTVTPMSKLTQSWVFGNVREFLLPYEKRTYMTNWTTQLQDTKWTEWVSTRIDEIQKDPLNGCKLSIQIQPFGGNFSAFRTNAADGKTAFSWRDSTICCVLDCFYDKPGLFVKGDPYITARQWQEQNDKEARGKPEATFCDQDRRVLWGSYDHDLIQAAQYYFEPGKWERILGAKKRWDPLDVFTANRFAVSEVAPTEIAPPVAMAAAHPYVMAPEQETEATYEAQMVSRLVERRENFLNEKQAESEGDKSLEPALKDEHQMGRMLKSDTERMEHQTTKSTCCK